MICPFCHHCFAPDTLDDPGHALVIQYRPRERAARLTCPRCVYILLVSGQEWNAEQRMNRKDAHANLP